MKQKLIACTLMMLLIGLPVLAAPAEEQAPQSFDQWVSGAVSTVGTLVRESGVLEVHGRAVRIAQADTVSVRIGVRIEKMTAVEAQQEASRIMNDVIAAALSLGVSQSEMSTGLYSLSQVYDISRSVSVRKGFAAHYMLDLELKDFALISAVLDAAVEKGANEIGDLAFTASNAGELYRDALDDAIHAAKEKAARMATSAEVTLHTLLELRESASQTSPYLNSVSYSSAMYESGSTQILPGEQEIIANVVLVYEIK